MASTDTLATRLKLEIQSRFNLTPTDAWLHNFLTTAPTSHPLAAIASTAHFRLLCTDFTSALITTSSLPAPDVTTKETSVQSDIPVQILDILDISTSKSQQIEAIDRVEKGEEIRGREVIRHIPVDGEDTRPSKGSTGPHKLLLQDASGNTIWAFEQERIERVTIVNTNPPTRDGEGNLVPSRVEGMQIGAKLVVKKGTKIRRGLVMLGPGNTVVLGGKVDVWDRKWREGRKARLQEALDKENEESAKGRAARK